MFFLPQPLESGLVIVKRKRRAESLLCGEALVMPCDKISNNPTPRSVWI